LHWPVDRVTDREHSSRRVATDHSVVQISSRSVPPKVEVLWCRPGAPTSSLRTWSTRCVVVTISPQATPTPRRGRICRLLWDCTAACMPCCASPAPPAPFRAQPPSAQTHVAPTDKRCPRTAPVLRWPAGPNAAPLRATARAGTALNLSAQDRRCVHRLVQARRCRRRVRCPSGRRRI
jgi:hypothetical protein